MTLCGQCLFETKSTGTKQKMRLHESEKLLHDKGNTNNIQRQTTDRKKIFISHPPLHIKKYISSSNNSIEKKNLINNGQGA